MLEEMLNLIEEEVVDRTLDFPGGDDEIVECVTWEVQDNNDEDDKLEDDEVEDTKKQITKLSNALDLCAHMEWLCLKYSAPDIPVLSLQTQLHKLWGHFRQLDNQSQVQVPLDHFWTVGCWHGLVFSTWSYSILYCI
jgi:hypothetical protein